VTAARALVHAHRPEPAPVQAKARPPQTVARSPKSARDPRFMRAVDRLQGTEARAPRAGGEELLRLPERSELLSAPLRMSQGSRFSSVLEAQRSPADGGARVSSPQDPAELEAEAIARMVASSGEADRAEVGGAPPAGVARLGMGDAYASRETMDEITAASPLGRPLPTTVRRSMEAHFRADFRGVRIHTGEQAARLSRRLSAQAFTVGGQIFFGANRFRPESRAGAELLAHELTHTIQQGAAQQEPAPQRREEPAVGASEPEHVQRLGFGDLSDWLADKANLIPGYRMVTLVLGVNPVNMKPVERSAANILRAVVEFLPGGGLIVQALDRYGVFDKVGSWIEGQLASLGLSRARINAALTQFIDSLGLGDLLRPGAVWDRAKAIFIGPVDRILAFVKSLAGQVLEFIKDAVLRPLAELASKTDGWDLLCAVLGKNPITGEAVPRTAETLIGGFMKLIGQQEIWENIKKANAIGRAWAWFQSALEGLLGFVRQIPSLFLGALKSLGIEDLVLLPQAFAKVGRAFAGFIGRFFSWAGNTVWNLLEIVFSVVAPEVLVYLRKAASAFKTILANPIGFVGNLIAAAKQGLSQFVKNFVQHLRTSLVGWLTGALSGAGIYIPQALTLAEVGKFVLSILGITWEKIRAKLVKVIGEPAMKALETGFDIVVALIRGGPAAAWELIKEKLTDLKDAVLQSIISFVKDKVVSAAVTKLLSMLSPLGAFIQAIIGIYNTIMFFVERLKQIARVAAAVIDSIAGIAKGIIASAANKVEQTMGGLLTLVISFLARIAGLGKVSDAVVNFVKAVQARVDQALDFAIDWVVKKAKGLFKSLFGEKKGERTEAQKKADLAAAVAEADQAEETSGATAQSARQKLPAIKSKYRLTSITLVEETADRVHVEAVINPRKSGRTKVFKPGDFAKGDLIQVRSGKKWLSPPAVIDSVGEGGVQYTHETGRGTLSGSGMGRVWRKYDPAQGYKTGAAWEAIKELPIWDVYNPDARQTLNYRYHQDFNNPSGKQWHHIHEQSAEPKGPNSVANLALTTSKINQELNVYFQKEAPSGTDGIKLREYLKGKKAEVHELWGKRAIVALGLTIAKKDNGRGPFQELA
jgi:hypothetical protein